MDKYVLVFDIIEHPESFTPEQLKGILSDSETAEIYRLLCKTESAVKANRDIDVEDEWRTFYRKQASSQSRGGFAWAGNRAATIAAIVLTSIVAVAAGIAVTVAVTSHKTEPMASDTAVEEVILMTVPADTIVKESADTDTIKVDLMPVMFEDAPLEAIMDKVATVYGADVRFNNKDVALLHLYYRLDPALPLDEIVAQLNTFEQINIKRDGNTLTVD